MVDTPGRCRELDYCSIGQMRTLVKVPLGRPFVCPECGKPLRAPAVAKGGRGRGRLAFWAGACLAGAALLYIGLGPSKAKHHIMLPDQDTPLPPPALRTLAVGQSAPAMVLQVVSITPTLPTLWVSETDAALPPTQPPPSKQAPPDQALPKQVPPRQDGKPAAPAAKVTMECAMDAGGVPSNCTPAPRAEPLPPAPKAPTAAEALPPAPPARAPTLSDRGFSPVTVAGGAPLYPLDYIHDGRPGEVAVSCTIAEDGQPAGCKVHDVTGGRRFAEATVDWLNAGAVHYAPIVRNGRRVAQEEHWTISFRPPR